GVGPNAARGARVTAVRSDLVKREPNSGTPSTSGLVRLMTLPSLISAAAAFVTAGVMRLVAPVGSSLPNGEAGTVLVQSLCAKALDAIAIEVTKAIPVKADISRMTIPPRVRDQSPV